MFVVNYAMVNSTLVLRSCDLFNPTGMSRTVLVNVGNAKEGLDGVPAFRECMSEFQEELPM